MTIEDETAKCVPNALRELLNGAICGGHCGDEAECSHYDATDRALSALSEAGYTVVKTEERSEYAVGDLVTDDLGQRWVREADQSWGWINWIDGECVIDNGYLDRIPTRPLGYVTNIGESPVSESDTLGGGDSDG